MNCRYQGAICGEERAGGERRQAGGGVLTKVEGAGCGVELQKGRRVTREDMEQKNLQRSFPVVAALWSGLSEAEEGTFREKPYFLGRLVDHASHFTASPNRTASASGRLEAQFHLASFCQPRWTAAAWLLAAWSGASASTLYTMMPRSTCCP